MPVCIDANTNTGVMALYTAYLVLVHEIVLVMNLA